LIRRLTRDFGRPADFDPGDMFRSLVLMVSLGVNPVKSRYPYPGHHISLKGSIEIKQDLSRFFQKQISDPREHEI